MSSRDSAGCERMRLLVDNRWHGAHGIARYAGEVIGRLPWEVLRLSFGRPATPFDPLVATLAIAARRPDAYYTPGFCPPLASVGVPYVVTVHDLIHLDEPGERSWMKSAFYDRIVRPGLLGATRIMTVSQYSRARIVEWAGVDAERVLVAPDGVSGPFTHAGPRFSPGGGYLLYVGNSKPHKNLRTLLLAMQMLGSEAPPLYLVGADPADVRRLAAGLSLDGLLHPRQGLSDAELATMYRGALALVFPSRFEGFGLPVVEAMACGCAVVSSDIMPVREVAGDAACYFDPGDPEGLAKCVRSVVADEALRQSLVTEGLRRASSFTWERTAQAVASAIEDAVALTKA